MKRLSFVLSLVAIVTTVPYLVYRCMTNPPIEPDVMVRVVSKEEIQEVLTAGHRRLGHFESAMDEPAADDGTNTMYITIWSIWDIDYGHYERLKNGTWIQRMVKP